MSAFESLVQVATQPETLIGGGFRSGGRGRYKRYKRRGGYTSGGFRSLRRAKGRKRRGGYTSGGTSYVRAHYRRGVRVRAHRRRL